jgi:hypothetical protein
MVLHRATLLVRCTQRSIAFMSDLLELVTLPLQQAAEP